MGVTKTAGTNRVLNFLKEFVGFKSKFEAKKFASVAITKFFTVYVFNLFRGLATSLVVPVLGAEMLSAIEIFFLLPISSIFVIIYFKLGKKFSRIRIASIFLCFFVIFYLFFIFYLYPNNADFICDLSQAKATYPRMKYILMLIENWHIALFYVFVELWGVMMLSLSFWQLANEVSTVKEAKKYYGFLGIIGQAGLVVAGWVASSSNKWFVGTADAVWKQKFHFLSATAIICAFCLLYTYYWIEKNIWKYVRVEERRYEKVSVTLKESFSYILSSKYLRLIATLVICYGVLMSFSEALWKAQGKNLYSDSSSFSLFLSNFQMYLGIGTMSGMLLAILSLRYCSWLMNALVTPISFLFMGIIFFSLTVFKDYLSVYFVPYGIDIIAISITVGMLQIIFAKSFKYSLFDLSKEMLYIPLTQELRTNGKAAVDIIGQRLGRSGGSIITFLLLSMMPNASLISLSPILFVVFIIMGLAWIRATFSLSLEFEALNKKRD